MKAHRDRAFVLRRGKVKVMIGLAIGGLLAVLLAVPVRAEIAHLTSIPLGRGTATITWTGRGGISPTANAIGGRAGGFPVSATDKVPKVTGISDTTNGSTITSVSIPSSLPIADVKGTIDGTPFTLDIVIALPPLSGPSKGSFGKVTGTFRNQKITAVLTPNVKTNSLVFTGTIGSRHIAGSFRFPTTHGDKTTAHASFDVTR